MLNYSRTYETIPEDEGVKGNRVGIFDRYWQSVVDICVKYTWLVLQLFLVLCVIAVTVPEYLLTGQMVMRVLAIIGDSLTLVWIALTVIFKKRTVPLPNWSKRACLRQGDSSAEPISINDWAQKAPAMEKTSFFEDPMNKCRTGYFLTITAYSFGLAGVGFWVLSAYAEDESIGNVLTHTFFALMWSLLTGVFFADHLACLHVIYQRVSTRYTSFQRNKDPAYDDLTRQDFRDFLDDLEEWTRGEKLVNMAPVFGLLSVVAGCAFIIDIFLEGEHIYITDTFGVLSDLAFFLSVLMMVFWQCTVTVSLQSLATLYHRHVCCSTSFSQHREDWVVFKVCGLTSWGILISPTSLLLFASSIIPIVGSLFLALKEKFL